MRLNVKLCVEKLSGMQRTFGSVIIALGLASCQATDLATPADDKASSMPSLTISNSESAFVHPRLNGHKAIALNDGIFVANSENLGLFLFDQNRQVLSATKGNYEGLDVRTIAGTTYVISINKELGQTDVYALKNTQLALAQSVKLDGSRVSNVCFYQPNNRELQAILLTEDMRFEQRLILDDTGKEANFKLIRSLSAPPHTSACAVNDTEAKLYLAEETNAIWAYPLNPEDEVQRTPVAMAQPFGLLEGEIKDLSVLDDGRLVASMPDMQSVVLLQKSDDAWSSFEINVGEETTPESASLAANGQLVWFDKETDSYQVQKLELPKFIAQTNEQSGLTVVANAQTTPVEHFGDAADDPAIWPNHSEPSQSKILGTDKSAGLYVYNLQGEVEQFLPTGRVNNVDISFGFSWQGKQVDLAAASNRTLNAISLYAIDASGLVNEIGSIATDLPDVYGLCSYKSVETSKHYVFINDENGTFQQYEIKAEQGQVSGKMVRQFSVPSQPEGCVADSKTSTLYLGEEAKGVWKTGAEPYDLPLELVIKIDEKVLFDDVEGLAIYQGKTKDYLVVSSQGNNSYVLYDLADLSLAGNFKVKANYQAGIDGTSETDGLAVSSFNFGGAYQSGLLVVQDGRNVMPSKPQNFKLISWDQIHTNLALKN